VFSVLNTQKWKKGHQQMSKKDQYTTRNVLTSDHLIVTTEKLVIDL
jgi:hypothetical protein